MTNPSCVCRAGLLLFYFVRQQSQLTHEQSDEAALLCLYNENHAIVAWLKRGFADEQKRNIRESDKNSYIEEREN